MSGKQMVVAVVGVIGLTLAVAAGGQRSATQPANPEGKSVYDFVVKDIDGKDVPLSKYKGDVLMIVNVASKCGYTKGHYEKLEPLYQKYRDKGFKVLAFPANNFGSQEPGSDSQIKEFCTGTYHTTFDLFSKVSVKGDDQCPLYKYLTTHPNPDVAGEVKWNFQKYLVDRKGNVIAKYLSKTHADAADVVQKIEMALAEPK